MNYGFTTKYTGSGIYPSQANKMELTDKDFRTTSSPFVTSKNDLIEDITHAIKSLTSSLNIYDN
jgi:hypothetical protein